MESIGVNMKPNYDKSHGSPYDRGSADRYYGRTYRPNKWKFTFENRSSYVNVALHKEIILTDDEEIAAYDAGWNEEDDRKDWGRD